MKTLNLNELGQCCPHVDPVQTAFYAQGAVAALENQGHAHGVTLTVNGDFNEQFSLDWAAPPDKSDSNENPEKAHDGALAIGIFLATSLTEYTVLEQSPIGTGGFDYYLGYPESDPRFDPDNFMRARLEVSGLEKGTLNEIAKAIREKKPQSDTSDLTSLPAFVSVTAFGKPISFLSKK